jgi:hypothetical protein
LKNKAIDKCIKVKYIKASNLVSGKRNKNGAKYSKYIVALDEKFNIK